MDSGPPAKENNDDYVDGVAAVPVIVAVCTIAMLTSASLCVINKDGVL